MILYYLYLLLRSKNVFQVKLYIRFRADLISKTRLSKIFKLKLTIGFAKTVNFNNCYLLCGEVFLEMILHASHEKRTAVIAYRKYIHGAN
jgi:hypothetical protein